MGSLEPERRTRWVDGLADDHVAGDDRGGNDTRAPPRTCRRNRRAAKRSTARGISAFGCVLCRVLAGRPAFGGETVTVSSPTSCTQIPRGTPATTNAATHS